jgi:hypothetical protein
MFFFNSFLNRNKKRQQVSGFRVGLGRLKMHANYPPESLPSNYPKTLSPLSSINHIPNVPTLVQQYTIFPYYKQTHHTITQTSTQLLQHPTVFLSQKR